MFYSDQSHKGHKFTSASNANKLTYSYVQDSIKLSSHIVFPFAADLQGVHLTVTNMWRHISIQVTFSMKQGSLVWS